MSDYFAPIFAIVLICAALFLAANSVSNSATQRSALLMACQREAKVAVRYDSETFCVKFDQLSEPKVTK